MSKQWFVHQLSAPRIRIQVSPHWTLSSERLGWGGGFRCNDSFFLADFRAQTGRKGIPPVSRGFGGKAVQAAKVRKGTRTLKQVVGARQIVFSQIFLWRSGALPALSLGVRSASPDSRDQPERLPNGALPFFDLSHVSFVTEFDFLCSSLRGSSHQYFAGRVKKKASSSPLKRAATNR